jgi:hypothetical protein
LAQVFISFKVRDKTFAERQFSQLADILSSAPHKELYHTGPENIFKGKNALAYFVRRKGKKIHKNKTKHWRHLRVRW